MTEFINTGKSTQNELPVEFAPLNRLAIKAMLWLNGLAHIIIGLALATSVIMFTWLFSKMCKPPHTHITWFTVFCMRSAH